MPTTTYAHFRDVPESAWRWPSFSPAEIACRGTGAIKINTEAMDKLQSLRNRLGKPLIVRSGYRSPSHNRAVGGAPASKHMQGTAFDIAMSNHDPVAFAEAARAVGFLGFGTYPRSGFMHIDLGPAPWVRAGRERDGEGDQQKAQRFARRAAGEDDGDPGHHRWPRFQSSTRAWMATAMPIRATAMKIQRRVSR